jgi:hypothetical protein
LTVLKPFFQRAATVTITTTTSNNKNNNMRCSKFKESEHKTDNCLNVYVYK